MPYLQNSTLTKLLLKRKDRFGCHYDPISLLGTTYQIVSKLFVNILNGFLCEWFLPSQTSFVHGRNILNNFSLTLAAILWVEESKQNMVTLLLNCEKHMIDFFIIAMCTMCHGLYCARKTTFCCNVTNGIGHITLCQQQHPK